MNESTYRCALLAAFLTPVFLLLGCVTESAQVSPAPRVVAATPAPVAIVEEIPVRKAVVATNTVPFAPEPVNIALSVGAAEIAKLAEAGMNEKVMLAFVENYDGSFDLTALEIVYLNDLGIPEPVIALMIGHQNASKPSAQIRLDEAGLSKTETSSVAAETLPEVEGEALKITTPETQLVPVNEAPSVSITAATEFETGVAPPAPAAVDSPAPIQSNYFYSSLEPYGRWVDVPGYGVCWQPTAAVVNPSWQPYLDNGRWVSSSAGWYWHSNYSWGWAPFHYGRWHRHPARGWVWLPGSTWGPAWVTWRYSDSYVGWAPLPPGAFYNQGFGLGIQTGSVGIGFDFGLSYADYGFVPYDYFYGPAPWRHRLPHSRGRDIYHRTTIINNYTQAPDRSIVHHGPSRTPGATFRQSGIRSVTLQERPLNHSSDERPGQMRRRGSEVVVFRPEASAGRAGIAVESRRQTYRISSPAETETRTDESSPVARRSFNSPASGRQQSQTRGLGRELTRPPVSGLQATPSVSEWGTARFYSPPSRFDRPSVRSNPGVPDVNRGFPSAGPRQSVPSPRITNPNIRTTPLPQRPAPIPVQPSQVTPSPRAPNNVAPSRTGGSARGRRSQ